jgi:hypothetical protein
MQTFLVTLIKGRNRLQTRCRAHKAQSATIAAAKLNLGWVVVDVMAIGPGRGGSKFKTASPRHPFNGQVITPSSIRAIRHITATVFIPDPAEVRRIRNDLAQRQAIRIDARLPPLNLDWEFQHQLRLYSATEYRRSLKPYLAAALAATEATGGMVATMRRHSEALREAKANLYHAEGLHSP